MELYCLCGTLSFKSTNLPCSNIERCTAATHKRAHINSATIAGALLSTFLRPDRGNQDFALKIAENVGNFQTIPFIDLIG